ncbi:MAG: GTPase ObgE [Actinomycetota bacterium]
MHQKAPRLVDEAHVFFASGKGGDGSPSFHREKFKPRGGPDGGSGGNGGSVVLVAGTDASSLAWLRNHPHQKAPNGINGGQNNRTGASAPDRELNVPVGTLVKDEQGRILADLAQSGDRVVVARGGRGGRGNAALVSPRRRAPGFAELGEPGEEIWLRLELRLIADVAIVGLPNAGKSTLVGALSRAHPKVADYPFTTLEPSLGVVDAGDITFTVCDIPGLIEGAHEGKGLGLKFLRHATRSSAFVHMIDLSAEGDLLEDHAVVLGELREFREDLAKRPTLVALNKVDLVSAETARRARQRFEDENLDVVLISAAERIGLDELTERLADIVATRREQRDQPRGFELFARAPQPVKVEAEDGAWRITGGNVQRWVAMTDLSNPEAVSYLQDRMQRAGVEKALEKAGARHGDEVRIGDSVFDWWPSGSMPEDFEDVDD